MGTKKKYFLEKYEVKKGEVSNIFCVPQPRMVHEFICFLYINAFISA